MSRPRKLSLSSESPPLPQPQARGVALTGATSILVAALTLGVLVVVLSLIPILGGLMAALPPIRVIAISPLPSTSEVNEDSPDTSFPRPLPSPPTNPERALVVTHLPQLDSLPPQKTLSPQVLSARSASNLELLANFEIQEALRLQEIAQKQAAAEIQRLEKQAEAAKRAQELAAKREQEELAQARKRKAIAAAREVEKKNQQTKAKEVAALKKQESLSKTVASVPSVVSRKVPSYPTSARRAGWEGTTRITATISSKGKVSSAYVSQSSGHQSLDRTALAAVKRWKFSPARNGLGEAISHQVVLPIPFRLN